MLTPDDHLHGPLGVGEDGDETRSIKWGTVGYGVETLEEIPRRPGGGTEWDEWQGGISVKRLEELEKVVKIGSGLDFIVALKGNGEVWFRSLELGESWEFVSPYQYRAYSSYLTSPGRPSPTSQLIISP
jgi:SCF-associated factor 1